MSCVCAIAPDTNMAESTRVSLRLQVPVVLKSWQLPLRSAPNEACFWDPLKKKRVFLSKKFLRQKFRQFKKLTRLNLLHVCCWYHHGITVHIIWELLLARRVGGDKCSASLVKGIISGRLFATGSASLGGSSGTTGPGVLVIA